MTAGESLGSIPCSALQVEMLAMEAAAPNPGMYNVTGRLRLDPPVDPEAVRSAVAYLVERHEPLRTRFPGAPARPHQVIAPAIDLPLATTDLGGLSAPTRHGELLRLVTEQDGEPFDLQHGPVFRVRLYDLGDDGAEAAVTLAHLICDETALTMLLHEFGQAYGAFARADVPVLEPLTVQYADYAVWQRQWLTDEVVAKQLAYWQRRLAGVPAVLHLPYDRAPESPEAVYRPARPAAVYEFELCSAARRALVRLAGFLNSTSFVLLVAGVQSLVSLRTGQHDQVVSTIVSGRDRPELAGMLGDFAGLALLRTDLSGDPTFAEVADRAREAVLGLFENRDVAFNDVVGAVARSGTDLDSAVHPVDVQLFHAARDEWAKGAAVVAEPPACRGHRGHEVPLSSKPLSFAFFDDGTTLWCELGYRTEFFDPGTVERLVAELERLFVIAGDQPGLRLSELAVLLSSGVAEPRPVDGHEGRSSVTVSPGASGL